MQGMYLATLIRQRRIGLGLSIRTAADKAKMPYWSWYSIERRGWERRPNADTIARMAAALDIAEDILWAATGCTAPDAGEAVKS